MEGSSLLWVKVILLLLAGGVFFWWQFHDLAKARKANCAAKKPPEDRPEDPTGF
jgi:hypothetical protein